MVCSYHPELTSLGISCAAKECQNNLCPKCNYAFQDYRFRRGNICFSCAVKYGLQQVQSAFTISILGTLVLLIAKWSYDFPFLYVALGSYGIFTTILTQPISLSIFNWIMMHSKFQPSHLQLFILSLCLSYLLNFIGLYRLLRYTYLFLKFLFYRYVKGLSFNQ